MNTLVQYLLGVIVITVVNAQFDMMSNPELLAQLRNGLRFNPQQRSHSGILKRKQQPAHWPQQQQRWPQQPASIFSPGAVGEFPHDPNLRDRNLRFTNPSNTIMIRRPSPNDILLRQFRPSVFAFSRVRRFIRDE